VARRQPNGQKRYSSSTAPGYNRLRGLSLSMNTDALDQKIVAIINEFAGQLPQEQLDEMRDLVAAGERGIALENLYSQVYEYDVTVPKDVLKRIESSGASMGLDPRRWEILKGR
jgi:hypothetical protein